MSQISFNCQASMWSAFLFTPSYERGPAYEEAIRKNNPGTREVWLRCVYYFFVPRSRKAATSLSAPGRKLTLSTADFFFKHQSPGDSYPSRRARACGIYDNVVPSAVSISPSCPEGYKWITYFILFWILMLTD